MRSYRIVIKKSFGAWHYQAWWFSWAAMDYVEVSGVAATWDEAFKAVSEDRTNG